VTAFVTVMAWWFTVQTVVGLVILTRTREVPMVIGRGTAIAVEAAIAAWAWSLL
jgi:hypothetical protein